MQIAPDMCDMTTYFQICFESEFADEFDFELRSSGCSFPPGSGVDFDKGLLDVFGSDIDGVSEGGFDGVAPLWFCIPYSP